MVFVTGSCRAAVRIPIASQRLPTSLAFMLHNHELDGILTGRPVAAALWGLGFEVIVSFMPRFLLFLPDLG